MHDGLSGLLSKNVVELVLVVAVQELVDEGLTTELVDALHDLVSSSETKTREQGSVLLEEGGVGGILEDDLVGGGKADARRVTRNKELKRTRRPTVALVEVLVKSFSEANCHMQ